MSEDVTYRGKIKNTGLSPEEFLALSDDPEIPKWCSNAIEAIQERYYKTHIILGGLVYEVTQIKKTNYDDIFEMNPSGDGEFEFLLKYYNGGCGFDEAMEAAYENMKEDK